MKKALKKLVSAMLAVLMVWCCFTLLPQTVGKTVYASTDKTTLKNIYGWESGVTAKSGKCGDNLTWKFENGTLTISGTGDMWNIEPEGGQSDGFYFPNGWFTGHYYNKNGKITASVKKVVIGKGVTAIGNWAFYLFDIEEIVLPDSVTQIGNSTFYGCEKLTKITLPDSLKHIGDYAFYSSGLKSITIGKNVSYIGHGIVESDGSAKPLCTAINVNSKNKSYKSIDGVLFNKAGTTLIAYPKGKTATSYEVPESVTKIECTFYDTCLKNITIGKDVTSAFGGNDFFGEACTAINVNSENKNYCSVDGVLFNKAGTTLIAYPKGRTTASYEVPEGVTKICEGAFIDYKGLKTITLPSTLKTVEGGAFDISYGDIADNYGTLKTVYYNGTKNEWDKISITGEWNPDNSYYPDSELPDTNNSILSATIIYKGTPATITVTGSKVNVRKGAGTNYGVVASVKKGKTCLYTATKKVNGVTWYKITVNSKTSGWIIGTYVKVNSTSGSSSSSSSSSSSNAGECTLKITASTLKVRKGAGTGYGVVTTVKKGKIYPYTATKKVNGVTWYKIKVSDSVSGWVSGKYISLVTFKVKITGSTVSVRKGAGTGYGVLTSVKKGSTYTCTATKKVGSVTWYKIKVNSSVTGWISGKYAKKA